MPRGGEVANTDSGGAPDWAALPVRGAAWPEWPPVRLPSGVSLCSLSSSPFVSSGALPHARSRRSAAPAPPGRPPAPSSPSPVCRADKSWARLPTLEDEA